MLEFAKKVKELNKNQTARVINKIATNYMMYSSWFKD